jgi:malic enzyme
MGSLCSILWLCEMSALKCAAARCGRVGVVVIGTGAATIASMEAFHYRADSGGMGRFFTKETSGVLEGPMPMTARGACAEFASQSPRVIPVVEHGAANGSGVGRPKPF